MAHLVCLILSNFPGTFIKFPRKLSPGYFIVMCKFFLGPLPETAQGNKYIVTVTDYFSKWPEAAPLPDKTSTGVADFLFSVFCRQKMNGICTLRQLYTRTE